MGRLFSIPGRFYCRGWRSGGFYFEREGYQVDLFFIMDLKQAKW